MNKFPFKEKRFSLSFNQTGKLQVFVLYLSECLCLEYAYYENPPKKYYQDINYTNN